MYLGGDLHRVHPRASGRRPGQRRDESLDEGRVALVYSREESFEVTALEGVWRLTLDGGLADSAPYFTLRDAEGRLRTWLLLPPPRQMIGIGHLWLPSVPPAPGPIGTDVA